jgi:hypothetical protein
VYCRLIKNLITNLHFEKHKWFDVLCTIGEHTHQAEPALFDESKPVFILPLGKRLCMWKEFPRLDFQLVLLFDQSEESRTWMIYKDIEVDSSNENEQVPIFLDMQIHAGHDWARSNHVVFQFLSDAPLIKTLFTSSPAFRSFFIKILEKHDGAIGYMSTDLLEPEGPHEVFWLRGKPLKPSMWMTDSEIASN